MAKWYLALSADGKDTILGAGHSTRELGKAIGYEARAVNYYLRNKKICKKLNAKIICFEG